MRETRASARARRSKFTIRKAFATTERGGQCTGSGRNTCSKRKVLREDRGCSFVPHDASLLSLLFCLLTYSALTPDILSLYLIFPNVLFKIPSNFFLAFSGCAHAELPRYSRVRLDKFPVFPSFFFIFIKTFPSGANVYNVIVILRFFFLSP